MKLGEPFLLVGLALYLAACHKPQPAAISPAPPAAKMPEGEYQAVTIKLTGDGRVLFRGQSVPLDQLQATLLAAGIERRGVVLQADEGIPYSTITRVIDALPPVPRSGGLIDAPGPAYRELQERFPR